MVSDNVETVTLNPDRRFHKYLLQNRHYDPETGIWTHLKRSPGKIAGCKDKDGYIIISLDGILYRSARLAIFYMTGHFPKGLADHRNRIRDDDRYTNLRDATPLLNSRNRGLSSNNTSGVNGVWLDKTTMKYRSYINNINNKDGKRNRKNLGYFDTIQEATFARIQALKKLP